MIETAFLLIGIFLIQCIGTPGRGNLNFNVMYKLQKNRLLIYEAAATVVLP